MLLLLGAAAFLTAMVSAEERSAPQGPVVVRPVQVKEVRVRDVRVDQPAPHRAEQRPTFGVERPTDPGIISRPPSQRQSSVTTPRPTNRRGPWVTDTHRRHGRNRLYAFKPRYDIGYGVVVGYPVIYPYAYPYDPFSPTPRPSYNATPAAPNTYSNVDSLPAAGNVAAASSPLPSTIACEAATPCGGVSFDIAPGSAQVYVGGVFAGTVDDFNAESAPLLLAPGDHYIEVRLAGYRSASFDVTIAAGEVTPYQGTLEPLRLRTP